MPTKRKLKESEEPRNKHARIESENTTENTQNTEESTIAVIDAGNDNVGDGNAGDGNISGEEPLRSCGNIVEELAHGEQNSVLYEQEIQELSEVLSHGNNNASGDNPVGVGYNADALTLDIQDFEYIINVCLNEDDQNIIPDWFDIESDDDYDSE